MSPDAIHDALMLSLALRIAVPDARSIGRRLLAAAVRTGAATLAEGRRPPGPPPDSSTDPSQEDSP
ncbi:MULTISPECIES: hypothetical protein [Streptomyces]|uniref:hypothetical protein n=1 Tax=Streptomyces TaxID=1883 RepID=UPI00210BA58D|nr:hypothetical protein [Streptomyces longispororuber]MCQ4207392.1 hypothetical protein [Streptomyces longispororuber]